MWRGAPRLNWNAQRWLATAAASSSGSAAPSWLQRNKHGLMHLAFSGICVTLSAQLTVQAHKLEDLQEELHGRMRLMQCVRRELLQQAPTVAVATGLPPGRAREFGDALQSLAAELDARPVSSVPEGSQSTSAAANSGAGGVAAGAMGSAPRPRQMF